MLDRSRIFTKRVAPATKEWDDIVIPPGETWRIKSCTGHVPYGTDTAVVVVWDREGLNDVLFVSYGDSTDTIYRDLVGDGVKKISIGLINNLTSSTYLQGKYDAVLVV